MFVYRFDIYFCFYFIIKREKIKIKNTILKDVIDGDDNVKKNEKSKTLKNKNFER